MLLRLERIGPIAGLSASASFTVLFSVAVSADPTWGIGKNWLSDLGVSGSPTAANAFNTGCILAGSLSALFAAGVPRILAPGRLTVAGALFLALAGLFLVSVGIFTERYVAIHGPVSYAFFAALLLSWALLARPMHRTSAFGRFGGYLNAAAIVFVLASAFLVNAKTLEFLSVATAVAWGSLVPGVLLLKHAWVHPETAAAGHM